jgi:hypothetical protein
MKRTFFIVIFLLTEFLGTAYSQESSLIPFFPDNFKEEAFKHVDSLSSFGFRYANSKAETRTINYLKDVLSENHIVASIDTFKFQYFESQTLSVKINNLDYTPTYILIDPYEATEFMGNGYVFYSDSSFDNYLDQNLNDRIVITSNEENLFKLYENRTAKAIIILNENDFNSIEEIKNLEVSIQAKGELKTLESCNLIATVNPKQETDKEIIISAHWDSYQGPGADDNATGIGVMLELAKYFNSIKDALTCRIQCVAFGAEELGLIGSQAFIQKHSTELKNCMLVFNIDEVGGNSDPYIEMQGGVNNVPPEFDSTKIQPDKTLFSATDYTGRWINLNYKLFSDCSNVPDWLKNNITGNCDKLHFKFKTTYGYRSDHENFYPIGIVATNIAIFSDNSMIHNPDDIPDSVHIKGLEQSGKIVASVVLQTMTDKLVSIKTDFVRGMDKMYLLQNYPNPFNPSTTISFSLPKRSFVSLKIYDLIGREIATIVSEELPAGNYSRQWIAESFTSGVYFYRLEAGSFIETKKLILLR